MFLPFSNLSLFSSLNFVDVKRMAKNSEYINVDKILTIEDRPIVSGPCYHTSVVSQILHVIMEPTLSFIKHVLKYSFDFIDRIDTQCTVNTI